MRRRQRRAAAKAVERAGAEAAGPVRVRPVAAVRSDAAARFAQWRELAGFDTRGVLGGVAFLVMLAFGLVNLGEKLVVS